LNLPVTPNRSELLAAVERSPEAAAAHDKAGWVGLFTEDAWIEDPVGSHPHVGRQRIGRFYDTFIGPRQITFHRDVDIVKGTSVIRDLTLEVWMGATVRMMIPAFLRYDLGQAESDWKIERLRAYWELPAQMAQFLRHGTASVPASMQLASALLRNQRVAGTLGFAKGFLGAGRRGKRLVEQSWPCLKVIAAGKYIAAAVETEDGRGVLFAEIKDRGRNLGRVEVFGNEIA
jgi:hypothetical protein